MVKGGMLIENDIFYEYKTFKNEYRTFKNTETLRIYFKNIECLSVLRFIELLNEFIG